MATVPNWVTLYLESWRRRLYLFEWEITTEVSPHPDNEPEGVKATVTLYPAVLRAEIVFKDTILTAAENDDEARDWKKTVVHELLHIRLAAITEYVQADVLSELGPAASVLAHKFFIRQVEPTIEIMSEILLQLEAGETPSY